ERPVEDGDSGIHLQPLAVGEERRVQGLDAAVGAQLALLRGLDLELPGELAFEPVAAHLELLPEIELQIEREGHARRLSPRAALLPDDHHVLAELRQALLVELEIAAVGAQRSAERDALLDELGVARA